MSCHMTIGTLSVKEKFPELEEKIEFLMFAKHVL